MLLRITISLFFVSIFSLNPLIAQDTDQDTTASQEDKIRVFLDCQRWCFDSYMRDEINFVNFVRDKEDSDVHLLITTAGAGSGSEYTLQFIGRGNFEGEEQTLTYSSPASDTQDDEREGLVRYVRAGLFPYVATTDAIEQIDLTYTAVETTEGDQQQEEDPWNYWIFEVEGDISAGGEESRSNLNFEGGASAERTTAETQTDIGYNYDYNRRVFRDTDDEGNEEEDIFITRSHRYNGSHTVALGDHWTTGFFTDGRSSTRDNLDLSVSASPGIEFNVFPYSEYSSREITFTYMAGVEHRAYTDTTIYLKKAETLYSQELRSNMEFVQPWGEIQGRANFSVFMHDITKNRLDLDLELNFRIFRGLDLSLSGRYSIINDQLSIPAEDITNEEQLLNLRDQFTSYSYRFSVGLQYSFGSIYNAVVNPRFGGGGGGRRF